MSQTAIDINKLVKVFVKIRDHRKTLSEAFEAEDKKLEAQMDKVKLALLEYCKETGLESARTDAGTFYRTLRTRYTTNNWEQMNSFILEHGVPDLLEKRIHQGNMKQFLEENPTLRPQGLNVDSEYAITVRKK
jgi:hypothetical protein